VTSKNLTKDFKRLKALLGALRGAPKPKGKAREAQNGVHRDVAAQLEEAGSSAFAKAMPSARP
jgi:hypothetical protein